jgi:hypothetical protein
MTQETLELATQLLELKKNYELKLDLLSYENSKVAISFVPFWKENMVYDREEFTTFYDDKELVNLVKDYLKKKISNIQKQIDEL